MPARAPAQALAEARRLKADDSARALTLLADAGLLDEPSSADPLLVRWACVVAAECERLRGHPGAAQAWLDRAGPAASIRPLDPMLATSALLLGVQLGDDRGEAQPRVDFVASAPSSGGEGPALALHHFAAVFYRVLHGAQAWSPTDIDLLRWSVEPSHLDPLAASFGWDALATLAFRQGHALQAAEHYAAALRASARAGCWSRVVVSQLNIASALSQLNTPERVARWVDRAAQTVHGRGWPALEALVTLRRCSALRWQQRWEEAEQAGQRAQSVLEQLSAGRNLTLARLARGEVALGRNDGLAAVAHFSAALAESTARHEVDLQFEGRCGLAQAAAVLGAGADGLGHLDQAESLARRDNALVRLAWCAVVRAWLQALLGSASGLQAALDDAQRLVRLARGVPGFSLPLEVRLRVARLLDSRPELLSGLNESMQTLLVSEETPPQDAQRLARLETGWSAG